MAAERATSRADPRSDVTDGVRRRREIRREAAATHWLRRGRSARRGWPRRRRDVAAGVAWPTTNGGWGSIDGVAARGGGGGAAALRVRRLHVLRARGSRS